MEGQKRVQKTVNIQWKELLTNIIIVVSIFKIIVTATNTYTWKS